MLARIESVSRDAVGVGVPAKVNVYLAVRGRRGDGYHSIDTVMLPVSLEDRLKARRAGNGLGLRVSGAPGAPADATNTVWRAAQALRRAGGAAGAAWGARLDLVKRIPAGAGLGGGSADAAAALVALNRLWGCRFRARDLHRLAASVGSDVPFFLGRGPARATGRGERIAPVACRRPFHLVLVYPERAVSTREVYEALGLRRGERRHGAGEGIGRMRAALRSGDPGALGACLRNDLEEAALRVAPSLRACRRAMERLPFLGVGMSGSGSAYFGVCRDRAAAVALARRASAGGIGRAWAVVAGVP
jgi:4-diphosphocytidyl-2-C-methyl-D-erythritol kinase